ncbi:related to RNA binding motif protein [Phialocephala subalpina]|uniref:Related to RNA binding motif protein n=1 Tax=Phialocephala subalpina TaxID=576137 RepID=A0A1L7X0A6_9HELO|nr:related to RNA binding motif protein [Phialocephala subalpina]
MSHSRPRPSAGHDSTMYDDEPEDYYRGPSSSQGYQNSRQDYSRSPPRGPAGERPVYGERYVEDRHHNYDRRRSRSPRREGRGRYTDRDKEDYRSPSRDRSRSHSPYFGGPPNRNVILEGIPLEWTQEDQELAIVAVLSDLQILNELQHGLRLEGLEEVRLIKDKRTGQSRGFAFAQFVGISEARRFLDRCYPTVQLYGPGHTDLASTNEPNKVRIAYSRDRDDRDKAGKGEDDWKCEVCSLPNFSHRTLCFRCNAPRTRTEPLCHDMIGMLLISVGATAHGVVVAQANMSTFSGFATTGDSDVSPDGTASQFLLLRGLEPGVTEELLAKGVSKLCKIKAGTPPSDLQGAKKRQIASTTTDASLGAKDGSLRRVLLVRDRKTNDSWRYGFAEFNTVEDAQAAMAKYKASDKFTISSKPVLLSYIHAGVFVPVLHPLGDEYAKFTFSPLSNTAIKLMYWDEAAYANELAVATPDAPSAIKTKESEHAKFAAAAANEGLVGNGKDGEPKLKKRKVEKDSKVVAPHLQFWTNRHAELHGIPPKDPEEETSNSGPATPLKKAPASTEALPSQTFADLERKCCLLCSRQFKTEADVNKHERMSQLHRDNMKNEDLVSKALAKLNKPKGSATESSAYRDRAKERRQAFNQPKQPAAQHNRTAKESNGGSSPKKEKEEAPPVQSKGAALLGKMGWTAGEGLGAQGTGRTDAIVTELYSQGVGLGAQGGKVGDAAEEAHRQTKGSYADFVSSVKDKAKERFQSLA